MIPQMRRQIFFLREYMGAADKGEEEEEENCGESPIREED